MVGQERKKASERNNKGGLRRGMEGRAVPRLNPLSFFSLASLLFSLFPYHRDPGSGSCCACASSPVPVQTSLKIPDGKLNIFAISFCSCAEQEKLESLERSCNKAPLCIPSIDHLIAVSSEWQRDWR